ncbi:4Fe-4S dicluster domain-containing protein [Enterocloster lavalensis]|uniref:4Fe-4S dicluster domain-containing protein n=1 Tax=Enterocloster lavalensis TaxID=460384 RepID=UPI001D1CD252|nr:4Fe-4S dicluster domain-containing protein [Enterocloster lavalensis]MBS5602784.1 SLBB domain-containing protein [Enterocloster asparagiformis]
MELLEQIVRAGVVGLGGAGFPTGKKLDCRVEWLIVNGAECEPLLRTDRYLMRHNAGRVVRAAGAVARMVGAKHCVIALKRAYTEEWKALEAALVGGGTVPIELFPLDSFYPAGDEQVLVYEVTERVVPPAGIPLDVGAVVSNLATMNAISDAMDGIPLTKKYITVTGEVKRPTIVRAPVGTSFEECIRLAGGSREERYCVIDGGPMMGKVMSYEEAREAAVTKTTSGIIVLDEDHYLSVLSKTPVGRMKRLASAACIQCSYCTQLCPRNLLGHPLEPHKIMRRFAAGGDIPSLLDDPVVRQAAICCQCGVCEQYACPMGLTPRRINALIRDEMRKAGIPYERREALWEADPERRNRKLPTKRAAARSGVLDYYDFEIDTLAEAAPSTVRISLRQNMGAPAQPVVQEGDRVREGQLIARCPEGKLGADIHAGIGGVVTKVTDYIVIEARG